MDILKMDTIQATFTPLRTEDLKPGTEQYIGKRMMWQALWVIDHGEYEGQWAMHGRPPEDYFGFVPLCDLSDIVRM